MPVRVVDRTQNPPVVRDITEEEIALIESARIPIEHRYDESEIKEDGSLILRAQIRVSVLQAIVPRLRAVKRLFTR